MGAVDKSRVFCELCTGDKKDAGVAYCGGTTSLINHMSINHPALWGSETQREARNRNTENEDENH